MPPALTPQEREDAKRQWAAFITRILEVSKWSQRDLGEALGVSEAAVCRWLDMDPKRGRLPNGPAARLLTSIARNLGLVK